jgi:hypothetical protein
MEITGKVIHVGTLVEGQKKDNSGTWQKAEFAIEYGDRYPKKLAFQAFGDRVPDVLKLQEGQEVKVSFDPGFDPESREYDSKWFSQNNVWKIEHIGQASAPQPAANIYQAPEPEQFTAPDGSGDQLPF